MYNPENKETQFVQNLRLFESVTNLITNTDILWRTK